MEIYTVSFFGHREVNQVFDVEKQLEKIVRDIITVKSYVDFLIGREGEFDLLAASVIRRVTKECDYGNTTLILVLPYMKAEYRDNQQYYLNYYDEVEICSESSKAHFKAAIQIRNRNLVDRSNLVVCCIEHNSGGAYRSIQYAKQMGVEVLNIADIITT